MRGPNVMKGYYRAPEETAAAINAEGWFNTRDLARLENGYLFIEGRTKELIVHFGLNVYPAEVEAVLNTHPAVVRSAVIGRTIESEGGEEVVAFVQCRRRLQLRSRTRAARRATSRALQAPVANSAGRGNAADAYGKSNQGRTGKTRRNSFRRADG